MIETTRHSVALSPRFGGVYSLRKSRESIKDFPNLPRLGLLQVIAVLEANELPLSMIPALTGITRMTVYNWQIGKSDPYATSLDRLSLMAYRVLLARSLGEIPPWRTRSQLIDQMLEYDPSERADELLGMLPTQWTKQD